MATMLRRRSAAALLAITGVLCLAGTLAAQQPVDSAYTAQIRKFTTEPFFLTPLVDHLPRSERVPTPLAVLGHIAGAKDVLSYPEEIYRYMRAVAAATPPRAGALAGSDGGRPRDGGRGDRR